VSKRADITIEIEAVVNSHWCGSTDFFEAIISSRDISGNLT
jgi:hypothetical protein